MRLAITFTTFNNRLGRLLRSHICRRFMRIFSLLLQAGGGRRVSLSRLAVIPNSRIATAAPRLD
jgi:hypothetical protein